MHSNRSRYQEAAICAGADKNELGLDSAVLTALFVPDLHVPEIPSASQILHAIEKVDQKNFGESAIIDVSTGQHSRRGNLLVWIAAFHD